MPDRTPDIALRAARMAQARRFHLLMEPVVPLAVLLHMAGALYQQFWLKSGMLTRMLRPVRSAERKQGRRT